MRVDSSDILFINMLWLFALGHPICGLMGLGAFILVVLTEEALRKERARGKG